MGYIIDEQFINLMSPSYNDSTQKKEKEIKAMCDFVEKLQHNGVYAKKLYFLVPYVLSKVLHKNVVPIEPMKMEL